MIRDRMLQTAGATLLALALGAPAAMAAGDHEGGHGHDEEEGQGHDDGGHGHDDGGHGHGHGDGHDFAFGEAAPDAAPDRTVEVVARDTMAFEPARITVEPGEVVRFVVHNDGQLQHSFTLGSPEYQRMHDKEMQGMPHDELAGHMADEPNGMVVAPGDTARLTWRFEKGGPVQFACHIPGHYDAGMKGRIRVE